jgi:hypothetical protein
MRLDGLLLDSMRVDGLLLDLQSTQYLSMGWRVGNAFLISGADPTFI